MYNNYGYRPYFGNQMMQYQQPIQQEQIQPTQPYIQPIKQALYGKTVDSLDVVKSMDIPLDGSVNYFPLADGTKIATKQLQMDGTSKIQIYDLVQENKEEVPKYATIDDFKTYIDDLDIGDLKQDLKDIKKELKELKKDKK